MKSNKALLTLAAALLATVGLSGCNQPRGSITSVTLSYETLEAEYQGSLQFTATVNGEGKFNDTVSWSIKGTGASINEEGLLTNLSEEDGYVVVTATANGNKEISANATVTLYGVPSVKEINVTTFESLVTEETKEIEVELKGTGRYEGVTFVSDHPEIVEVTEEGEAYGKALGTANITVKSVIDETKSVTFPVVVSDGGTGYFNYSADNEKRTEILGKLEKYAVDTHLTGLSIFGNGSYVMYDEGIQKGTNTYIPGYGFGILGEGDIIADLKGEANPAWKRYYHSIQTSDPLKLNYMDSKESDVGDLSSYVTAAYFDTQMSATKDSYEWVGDLAKVNRPIPVKPAANGTAKTWKFPVKVGAELKYQTNTTVARLAAFNNREVELEDYITPYKLGFTKAYGYARAGETLTGSGSIAGRNAYYAASENGFNADAWKNVGIKAYVDENDGQSYLEFTFNNACTTFYAMYYLASGMYAPVPEAFVLECAGAGNTDIALGAKAWGVSSEDGNELPGDHWLSTGAYTVEVWNKDQNIVFKKNPNYADRGRYSIQGVHINTFPRAASDPNATFEEFLAGNISAAGIPTEYLSQYKSDPRTTRTSSTSNFKLNVNSCDEETWEKLFGVNGSIVKTNKSDYWDIKPAMGNKDFVDGLSYAMDRVTIADKYGRTPAFEYLSDNYMSDPENGMSYNLTQAHKDAVADALEGTDGYGYSLELAKASFKKACDTLIDEGAYSVGDTVKIEIAWMYESDIDEYHGDIKKFFEEAFNNCGGGLKLEVTSWTSSVWSDVYYKKLMLGQFDLGFGSISGNSLDPLNFYEVLKSDNSSGFTLNWGTDTSKVTSQIFFDGANWSFDSLWEAGDHGIILDGGEKVVLFGGATKVEVERMADGGLTVYLYIDERFVDVQNYGMLAAVCIYGTNDAEGYSDYYEEYLYNPELFGTEEEPNPNDPNIGSFAYDEENERYVLTFTAEFIAGWLAAYPAETVQAQGFDIYSFIMMGGEYSIAFFNTAWTGLLPEIPNP